MGREEIWSTIPRPVFAHSKISTGKHWKMHVMKITVTHPSSMLYAHAARSFPCSHH